MIEKTKLPVYSVQIVGQGYAPLLAAITLKKRHPLKFHIEVLSSPLEDTQKLTSTGNYFREFHNWLDINEHKFLRATKADLQHAINIKSDGDIGYFSESPTGLMIENTRFQHLFNYAAAQEDQYHDYNLGIKVHKNGRFTPPSNNKKSLFNQLTYGYIFQDQAYYHFLLSEAQALDIKITPSPTAPSLSADLTIFTDVPRADKKKYYQPLLKGLSSETHYEKGPHHGSTIHLKPELRHDLKHNGINENTVYSAQANQSSFGYHEKSFHGKTLLLGSAYADLPGLIIDPVFSLQSQLMSFCKLSRLTTSAAQAQIFNRNTQREIQSLAEIDEAVMYAANLGNINYTPETLHRIKLFSASGSITQIDGGYMTECTWLSLLYAILGRPKSFPAPAEALSRNDMRQRLAKVKKTISEAANKPPLYTNFLHSTQKDN
ncbi:tryptophan 7-halogenase [Marinagarivorans cellulosilyticus]|uniref:Tryptophan halogenase n=1 Tax=Marinagarivorans cellulosilyticus TaxID=2721545 RepID=A0AAN2BIX1_9GAMM|nr:tryptophan 7-halogenase [Marinagarivorans cellulosilyticus]BCD96316.1 hypothetical protein MARGE09_P0516 [Marinagarivorans cellulosilyticus]